MASSSVPPSSSTIDDTPIRWPRYGADVPRLVSPAWTSRAYRRASSSLLVSAVIFGSFSGRAPTRLQGETQQDVGPVFSMRYGMSGRLDGRRYWLPLVLAGIVMALLAHGRAAESPQTPRVQLGLASYYGPGFHGQETASGEIFDQTEMVAAHRTLPLGSVVRVTNLENGRQVVLRVIDRGPYGRNFRKGTIIDVSKGAARRLRFLRKGLIRVRVELIRAPNAPQDDRTGNT